MNNKYVLFEVKLNTKPPAQRNEETFCPLFELNPQHRNYMYAKTFDTKEDALEYAEENHPTKVVVPLKVSSVRGL